MALPLVPVAGILVRYGAIALAGYAISRTVSQGRRDQRAEDALDELDEGLTLRKERDQINSTARYKRTIRLGSSGPGVDIDCSALGRISIKRAK